MNQITTASGKRFEPGIQRLGITPREIVPVEIDLWPTGFKIHAGEVLQVMVSPYHSEAILLALGAAAIDIPADRYTFDPAEPSKMIVLSGSSEMVPPGSASRRSSLMTATKVFIVSISGKPMTATYSCR